MMAADSFTKGDFQSFRAITKVHLGQIESDIQEGEVVEFDGQTMKRGSDEHEIPVLKSAIKVGWLVPDTSPETTYRPKSAEISVHKAQADSEDRGSAMPITTVLDEEQDMGHLSQIRPEGAPPVHQSKNAGLVSNGAPTGAMVAQDTEGEGAVVGRLKSAARSEPVRIDSTGEDKRVVQKLDNKSKIEVDKPGGVATGDVQMAISAEELADLLPDAANADRPAPGIAGEGRGEESELRAAAAVSKGSSKIGGSEEGVIIGTVGETDPVAALQEHLPDFEWDMSAHWKTRVRIAVEKYSDNMLVMNTILSIEADSVKKAIVKRLYTE
tara:strand:- start:785 stop:1762 length:978 start_codon:yes stop_codon:yes gene_type:complete